MTLWRLEWLRMLRTRRLLVLVAVYAFFGIIGPFSARYVQDIVERFGGEVTVVAPDPVPADGIAQYVGNAQQLGLLAVVLVAAAALALDANRENAVFLRSRVARTAELVAPRYAVSAAATVAAFVVGALLAWYETVVLIGGLPVGGMLAGIALSALYLAFAVAVVGAAAAVARGVAGTAVLSLAVLVGLGVVGALTGTIGEWFPAHLVGALADLADGSAVEPYWRSALVAVVVTALLLMWTVRGFARRDV